MTIRPPKPTARRRSPDEVRDRLIIVAVSFLLVTVWMRALLALLAIETWTVSWRVVRLASLPLIAPLQRWQPLQRELGGHLTVAELVALVAVTVTALVTFSWMANRRGQYWT
jgi:hypothetical protein